jgi:hypothetical protein
MRESSRSGTAGAVIFALVTLLLILLAPHPGSSVSAGSHPDAAAAALESIPRR